MRQSYLSKWPAVDSLNSSSTTPPTCGAPRGSPARSGSPAGPGSPREHRCTAASAPGSQNSWEPPGAGAPPAPSSCPPPSRRRLRKNLKFLPRPQSWRFKPNEIKVTVMNWSDLRWDVLPAARVGCFLLRGRLVSCFLLRLWLTQLDDDWKQTLIFFKLLIRKNKKPNLITAEF